MEELKRRHNIILDIVQGKILLPKGIAFELCYLQLRMITELIALGCLAAHGDIPETKAGKFQKAYAPGLILKELERLHPNFYPVPGEQIKSKDGRSIEIRSVKTGFLTKEELPKLWAECGDKLHRGSIKDADNLPDVDFEKINFWERKIRTLLNHHQIQLQTPDYQMWVIMQSDLDGRVHGSLFQKIKDEDAS